MWERPRPVAPGECELEGIPPAAAGRTRSGADLECKGPATVLKEGGYETEILSFGHLRGTKLR